MSKARRDRRRQSRRGGKDNLGMSSKQMKNAMNQIQTDEVENVEEVTIRTATEEIILHNPEVTVMNVGQEIWNVVPQRVERKPLGGLDQKIKPEDVVIKDEDIQLIMTTANISRNEAENALRASGGDLAAAMMNLHD